MESARNLAKLIIAGREAMAKDASGEAPFICGLEKEATQKMIDNAIAALVAQGCSPENEVLAASHKEEEIDLQDRDGYIRRVREYGIPPQSVCSMSISGGISGLSVCVGLPEAGHAICVQNPPNASNLVDWAIANWKPKGKKNADT